MSRRPQGGVVHHALRRPFLRLGKRSRPLVLLAALLLIVPACEGDNGTPGDTTAGTGTGSTASTTAATAPITTVSFPNCETLDTLSVGTSIMVGPPPTNSFQPPKMDIAAHPFTAANGTAISNGKATTEAGGKAGGSNVEISLNNITLSISVGFGQTLTALRLSFGEYGGNLNLSINDKLLNFDNFASTSNASLGGVAIHVLSGGLGNDQGVIEFVGTMNDQPLGLGQIAVGGQELWIDDICFKK